MVSMDATAASVVTAAERARPSLTVTTTLPPPPPTHPLTTTRSRPPSAKLAASSSSLPMATSSPTASTTRKITSPSVSSPAASSSSSSKRASPRCSSPACASSPTSSSRDRLYSVSPTASTGRSVTTTTTTTTAASSPPISTELYFRLLKKSHVLDQLLHVHAHLATQQQHLRRLEADRARIDSVQDFVFQELEAYKRKFVEAQQFLLELLEALTALTVQEDELQRGTSMSDAMAVAQRTKEDVVVRDLETLVLEMQTVRPVQTLRQDDTVPERDRSLESSALRAVGLRRVEQLTQICATYESQLQKSEVELSRALHSAYKDECLAKLQRYEAMQQQHDDEIKALNTRIENLSSQTSELQGVIDDQRDELAMLRDANAAHQQRHVVQTEAIEKFGTELKAELRKRYGVVPSVVDARWHTFFPHCAAPE